MVLFSVGTPWGLSLINSFNGSIQWRYDREQYVCRYSLGSLSPKKVQWFYSAVVRQRTTCVSISGSLRFCGNVGTRWGSLSLKSWMVLFSVGTHWGLSLSQNCSMVLFRGRYDREQYVCRYSLGSLSQKSSMVPFSGGTTENNRWQYQGSTENHIHGDPTSSFFHNPGLIASLISLDHISVGSTICSRLCQE